MRFYSFPAAAAIASVSLVMPHAIVQPTANDQASTHSIGISSMQLLGRIGREAKRARNRAERKKRQEEQQESELTAEEKCRTAQRNSNSTRGLLGDIGRAAGLGEVDQLLNNDFSDVLADEIACQLTREEQAAAAEATKTVTEKEEVGATAEWKSPTREGVSGSSTVTAVNSRPNGRKCMTITDIAIVEGEETRVQKRMCRSQGEKAYVLEA